MLIITGLIACGAAQRTFAPLDQARSNISFVAYTPVQRTAVAQAVEKLLSVYVHRQAKIDYYGSQFPDIDPVPRASAIKAKASQMTDKEFHYAYAKLFLSLRDFHTNYNMPSPHRCYTAVTAVLFQLADSADIENDPAVVVSAYSSFKKVLSMSPEYNKTSLGDQLLKIDGLTFREYHLKTAFQTGGANLYGGYRSALSSISYIGGMMYPMPENNTLTLEMRSAKTQENYTVKLPWIASSKDACMKEYNDFLVAPKKNAFTTTPLKLKRKKELPSTNPLFKELKESFAIKQLSIKMQATSDPIITYAIFNPNAENLGIIAMDSFLPLGSDIDKLVLLIRSLLVGELANTKSLVFDIRDNGGGAVSMADLIPQLFGRNPYIAKFRALVSPLNQKLFSAGYEGTDWARNYNASKPGDLFTPAIAFDSDKRANRYGQAYFKPVGVLNNGNCYSSCDFFSSIMQDNGVAWIFGEDKQTGAGGANVVEYTGFFSAVLPKDFPILPFVGELATTHQDMRVAWRQGVRQGPNAGKLLEDFGVVADSIVRPYVADIVNSTSDSQWVRISEQLGRIGASSGLDKVAFSTRPDLYSKVSIGDDFNIQVETSGLSRVIINYENGTLISEIDLKAPNTVLSLPKTASSVLGLQRYQLLAKDNKGKTVVETYRFVRVQPAKDGWLTLNATTTYQGPNVQTLTLDSFKTSQASVDFYNPESDALLGWRYNGSVLLVGDGVKYRDNVETRISIFGHAAPIVSVKIVADYDTELDYDYFTIGYVDQKGENSLVSTTAINTTTTINGVSGNGQIDQNFEINPVGDFEFYMQFKSDGGTTAQGVTISTLHMIGGVFE